MSTNIPDNLNESGGTRMTLPYIDTSVKIKGFITYDNILSFAVPFGSLLIALIAWTINAAGFALIAFLNGIVTLGIVMYFTQTNPFYLSTRERLRGWIESRRLQQKFPYRYYNSLGRQLHGVERLYPDGTAKMSDGRRVGLVGVKGMNTSKMNGKQAENMVNAFSNGIDEQIRNIPFSIYATTTDFDAESLVEHYIDRADKSDKWGDKPLARTGRAEDYVRELLLDVAGWFMGTESPVWSANEWEYYVVVSIQPYEVNATQSSAPESESLLSRLLPTSTDTGAASTPEQEYDSEMNSKINDRMAAIENALNSVEGIESERAGVLDHAGLLLRYWTGESSLSLGDEVSKAMADDDNRVNVTETPTERLLTPSGFGANNGMIELGDELCKTYSIMEWPVQPDPFFLSDLFTMEGVNIDVRIHVEPEHKQEAINDMELLYADVESEQMERQQNMDASKIQIQNDKDAVRKMYLLLRNTTAQPWQVSMYVTVRVGPREAYEYAQQSGRSTDDLYLAKVRALEAACNTVLEVLTSTPANLGPRHPTSDAAALDMFESCSPTGGDLYHETGDKSKRTRMLGGSVAAMFPWCGGVMQEPGGLRLGRNKQNGSAIFADPFERGAPHILTLGQTRSGKTYSVQTALAEWFSSDPTRTLIVCDTEQGFEGLTHLCGGKHVVVDGEQTINPFDIQKPPQEVIESGLGGSNHFQMKIDEVTSFFAGILRAQGIDPSRFMATIEDAVQETYENNGISRDPATHSKSSPTISEFIDVLKEMLNNPGRFTFTGHDSEAEQRIRVVSDLLDKLSGFKEGRKYHHMVGSTDAGIRDRDVDMAYIDLSQFSEASEAEKSVMLHLIFGQVYQKVKRSRGEIIFLIDEAHFLLHSREMIEYLQDAARSWARYDAALWFVTQSPREFIERAGSMGQGEENQRRTILDQCSTIQTFRTPRIEPELLMDGLGQNRQQADFVRNGAVTGKSSGQYSECLIHFQDRQGWWESHVEASPFEDLVWNYMSRNHGNFDQYLVDNWGDLSIHPNEIEAPDETGSDSGDDGDNESSATSDAMGTKTEGHPSSNSEQSESAREATDTTNATAAADGGDWEEQDNDHDDQNYR